VIKTLFPAGILTGCEPIKLDEGVFRATYKGGMTMADVVGATTPVPYPKEIVPVVARLTNKPVK
jgi:hypothetical protein